jgi:hypothetical protein
MKKIGFTLLSEKYKNMEQNPFGAIQSLFNVFLKKRDVLFERLKGNKNYAKQYGVLSVILMKLILISLLPICILSDVFIGLKRRGATVELIFRKDK